MCFMDEMEYGCFPEPRGLCPSGEGKSIHIPSSPLNNIFSPELDNRLYPTGCNIRVFKSSCKLKSKLMWNVKPQSYDSTSKGPKIINSETVSSDLQVADQPSAKYEAR